MGWKLRLLGAGPVEDIQCVLITAGGDEDEARARRTEAKLRARAQRLQAAWFAAPESPAAKLAYARALRTWGHFVGERPAIAQANYLLAGGR
jgi:hypothetical protein